MYPTIQRRFNAVFCYSNRLVVPGDLKGPKWIDIEFGYAYNLLSLDCCGPILQTNWDCMLVARLWTNLDSGSDHVHGVGDGGGSGGSQGSGHGLQHQVRAVARCQFGELLWKISRAEPS